MLVAEQEETVTIEEFAQALGWKKSTVQGQIRRGKIRTANTRLPGLSRVGQWLIPRSEIERIRRGEPLKP